MEAKHRLSGDFWRFWTGQVISNLGSSFTFFAIPLLIFKLTGSSVNLALTMAAAMLPYLFFGLIIGAWADRLDRKKMMILSNVGMCLTVGSIPILAATGHLSVWFIYASAFVNQTINQFFAAGEFAAIPSLVEETDLVTANGRIQGSYFATMIIGPIMAGGLAAVVSIPDLLVADSISYLVSAAALLSVRRSFNLAPRRVPTSVRQDIVEGLRYVLRHPVLRNISAMMALFNFFQITIAAQLVLFAKLHLHSTNSEIGLLFGAEGVGAVLFSLNAGRVRKHLSFSQVVLGTLALDGLFTLVLAFMPSVWPAIVPVILMSGFGSLLNINTQSLRQMIVPNEMLGRVMSIAGVLAWSAIPVGALLGGFAIQATNVQLVYAVIGVILVLIPLTFAFTALSHADRYIGTPEPAAAPGQAVEAEASA